MKSTDYPGRDSKLPALDSRFSVLDSKLSALGGKLPAVGGTCDSCDAGNKKSHEHSSATAMPGKTRKFLDKITSKCYHVGSAVTWAGPRSLCRGGGGMGTLLAGHLCLAADESQ